MCELTGLRSLTVDAPGSAEGLLLQLPQLTDLINLNFTRRVGGRSTLLCLTQQVCVSTTTRIANDWTRVSTHVPTCWSLLRMCMHMLSVSCADSHC